MKNRRTANISRTGFLNCRFGLAAAKDGVVGLIFALSLFPLALAVGLAIDVGRAHIVKQRLVRATDAAGLAVGAALDSSATDTEIQAVLDNFFDANFPDDSLGASASASYTYDGTTYTITTQVQMETTFMQLVNIDSLAVSASSKIKPSVKMLEVALVLDNTYSMNANGKIDSLKTAALSLIDILFGGETAPDNIFVSLVPFSGAVNVGTANTSLVTDTTDWNGCLKAQSDPDDVRDNTTGPWDPLPPATGFIAFIIGSGCPQQITPLTNSKSTLDADINSMFPTGYTHINVGAVWGWRAISSNSPFTEGSDYSSTIYKVMLILTDGENYASQSSTAYADDSQSSSDLDLKLAAVCSNIKAEDITVYTITFDLADAGTQTLFRDCATDSGKYFNSPGATELTRAFRIIAAQLRKLHVAF